MKKEKRYFIEITIKDSDTLESVRSISTSSDYPESVLVYPHTKLLKEVDFCVNTLCSTHFGNNQRPLMGHLSDEEIKKLNNQV